MMALRSIAMAAALTVALGSHVHGAEERDQWPIQFWKDFIQTSADSTVPDAFGSDRFPLIESLIRLAEQRPEDAQTLKAWLSEKMRANFRSDQREKAYLFKGFFTCLKDGGCNHLVRLDPRVNSGAEPFEPDLSVSWKGNGEPAGRIEWSAGKLGYRGRTDIVDEYWDDERGAYVMLWMRTFKNSSDSKALRFPIEIAFYSSCTFTGYETRKFGEDLKAFDTRVGEFTELGGYCPRHELFQQ